MSDKFDFMVGRAEQVAPRLLGCELACTVGNQIVRCKIVETEAYDQSDAASHSYKGETPRTGVMFGPPSHLYVYFTYGMHYCCNIVCGEEGVGSAVLIRAVEPLNGLATLATNRKLDLSRLTDRQVVTITNGPAKLCQALAIDKRLNGHNLHESPVRLVLKPALNEQEIVRTTRIGITKAMDMPWRFYIAGNPFVSKQ